MNAPADPAFAERVRASFGRQKAMALIGARLTAIEPGATEIALAYREDPVKPSFVVDISAQMERKMAAIRCYASQFDGAKAAGEIFPTGQDLYSLVEVQNAHYGSLIRTRFGEPFWTPETMRVDDVVGLEVQSM